MEAGTTTERRALLERSRLGRLGGTAGNERLTAATGAVLVLLLAAEGVTILFIRPLLSAHFFVGMLLVPPVALKLAVTGYRFARYYTRAPAYVRRGPPHALMRLLAPVVVVSTVGLFASGVALAVLGPGTRFVLPLHKASFVVWLVATGAHVLWHVLRVPRLAAADWRRDARVAGAGWRRGLLAAALVAGLVLALTTVQLAHPWAHWAGWAGG